MVQTEAQYKFVYLALQRYIQREQLRLREQVGAGKERGGACAGITMVTGVPSSQSETREESDYQNVSAVPVNPGRSPGPAPSRVPAAATAGAWCATRPGSRVGAWPGRGVEGA